MPLSRPILLLLTTMVAFTSCRKTAPETFLPKAIVIGSSIAAGVGATDKSQGWVEQLRRQNPDMQFVNLSVPGTTTYHFLPTAFASSSLQQNRPAPLTDANIDMVIEQAPKLIIISITTNDIKLGFSPEEYLQNMATITGEIRKAGISFLITSTTLRSDIELARKRALLQVYHGLNKTYPANFIDIFTTLADSTRLAIYPSLYSQDKIHPNNEGHTRIFEQINNKLVLFK